MHGHAGPGPRAPTKRPPRLNARRATHLGALAALASCAGLVAGIAAASPVAGPGRSSSALIGETPRPAPQALLKLIQSHPAVAAPLRVVAPVAPGLNAEGVFGAPIPGLEATCLAFQGTRCATPYQLEKAYGLAAFYRAGVTGTGRTIAVLNSDPGPHLAVDLQSFDQTFGLPQPPSFRVVAPFGQPPYDPTDQNAVMDNAEASIDTQWAHAIAPGARIVELVSGTPFRFGNAGVAAWADGFVRTLDYAVRQRVADVISISYAWPEEDWPSATLARMHAVLIGAAQAGITVVAGSGDIGTLGTDNTPSFLGHPIVNYPASDPLVTAVGGTDVELGDDGVRLVPDIGWSFGGPDGYRASGGGLSALFPRPWWQGRLGFAKRALPDISMMAGPAVPIADTDIGGIGLTNGTSLSGPLLAGVIALVDQRLNVRVGPIGPALYTGPVGSAIVDVSSGSNAPPPASCQGLLDCSVVGGYAAGPGYDLVTGLGTLNGDRLATLLRGTGKL